MLVFRDGREHVSGPRLLDGFLAAWSRAASSTSFNQDSIADALLRAGELECALADAGSAAAADMARVTDTLAAALASHARADHSAGLERLPVPDTLTISAPEGFAYYALHPLDYAELARRIPLRAEPVALVGIRSIGTTLSAVVLAALQQRGARAARITLRPTGHPFNRTLEFTPEQSAWVANHRDAAEFWVVDEGPGLSGSSFLSVGEALLEAGVPAERIAFLCSGKPAHAALHATNAAARWQRFATYVVSSGSRIPSETPTNISAGRWRERFLSAQADWPASWTQFERLKYLSAGEERLFKFEGLGRFGAEAFARARLLSDARFGPPARAAGGGFVEYPLLNARSLIPGDLSRSLIDHLARYCAFRRENFATEREPADLAHMLSTNLHEEFGEGVDADLRVEKLIVTDGRMHPHEWLLNSEGEILKVDAVSHGDDHFYPGPTDIAWDLAGAIVEWAMDAAARNVFLHQYQQWSGDDPRPRLPGFLLAYTMFRLGYCRMAAEALRGTEEEPRLQRDYHRYRAFALRHLAQPVAA
jgi:hypothetical protein